MQTDRSIEFVLLMAAMMSIVAVSIDAMLPALSIIGAEFDVTHPNQPQLIISCIFCGMAIGQLVCGPLSDALGRKRLLYFALGLYLVGTVICLFAENFFALLFGRITQGVGVAGPYVSTISIVRDRYTGNAMARIMSLVMMIFIMVPAVAPTIGLFFLAIASWHAIFVFFLLYAAVILLWAIFRLEETLPNEMRKPFKLNTILAGAKEVLSHRSTVKYLLCSGCIFGALIGYLNSCLQIFQELYNVGGKFALYFGFLALTLGIASLFNARLVCFYAMRSICKSALIGIIGATLILLFVHVFMKPPLWGFLVFAGVIFFCFGLVFGNINAMAMEPMGHIAGTAAAIIGASSSVISIIAGTLIGQFYNQTLYPLLFGFLILASLSLSFILTAHTKKQSN